MNLDTVPAPMVDIDLAAYDARLRARAASLEDMIEEATNIINFRRGQIKEAREELAEIKRRLAPRRTRKPKTDA